MRSKCVHRCAHERSGAWAPGAHRRRRAARGGPEPLDDDGARHEQLSHRRPAAGRARPGAG